MEDLKEINLNKWLDLLKEHENDKDIQQILESFQKENYEDAINYIEPAKKTFQNDTNITNALLLVELISFVQLEKLDEAKGKLELLYSNVPNDDREMMYTLGGLAGPIDLKIARKIFSQLVKLLEGESEPSSLMIGKTYLLLAEIEENMNKLPRSIKYYQRGMDYLNENDPSNNLIAFLYFKIGVLNSAMDNKTEAIEYLKKGLAISSDEEENRIHILVSLGKIYGSLEKGEEAYSYSNQALELIEKSRFKNKIIHAEVLVEIAYYYFNLEKEDEALPYYEKALAIYHQEESVPDRKLGMIHMQYAHCLEHNKKPNMAHAGMQYETGLRYLEESSDQELFENALIDVIDFFDKRNNKKKKQFYESKALKLVNK